MGISVDYVDVRSRGATGETNVRVGRSVERTCAILLSLALPASLIIVSPARADPPAGFVTRDGGQLLLDGQPYRFTGLNIYFANSDGTCGPPFGSGPNLGEALSMMGSGAMAIRAWFFQAMATTNGQRDWSRFDHTLSVAAAHGVKVIPTLTNQWADCEPASGYKDETWYQTGYTQPDPSGTVSYRDFVAEVVQRYKDDPTILAWQLINEAEVKPTLNGGCSANANALLEAFASDISGLVKSVDPNHLVSLGTIGSGQCGAQGDEYRQVHAVPTIDLCEYHDYTPNATIPGDQFNGLQVRFDQCAQLDKPLFIGEQGIRPVDVGGGLHQRADVFRAKLRDQLAAGAVGIMPWAWLENGSIDNANYDIERGDPMLRVLAGAFATGIQSIGSGDGHLCAVTQAGGVKCWGDNYLGDLGDGTLTQRNRPVDVVGISSGAMMALGGEGHTCAEMASGSVRCWGENNDGQLGIGVTTTHNPTPQEVVGISAAQAVAAEGDHSCALLSSGAAQCWGSSGNGELGYGFPIGGARPTPTTVQSAEPFQQISAGWNHTCAVTVSSAAKCWGTNAAGQVGDGNSTNTSPRAVPVDVFGLQAGVVSIAAGMGHTCALTLAGVECWGSRASGQLGDGQISNFSPEYTPVDVIGLSDGIQTIGVGAHHSCAITASGGLRCWGDNDYGQLGNNSTADSATPVQVSGLTSGVLAVVAGRRHTCALVDDGTVWCWGENQFGQLGRGPGPGSLVPVMVDFSGTPDPDDPTSLGQFHAGGTMALPVGGTTDGTTVVIKGAVSDPNGNDVRLEVEVKAVGMPFDGTDTVFGGFVVSGGESIATIEELVRTTHYRWRVRTVSSADLASNWVVFGGNAESEADFVVEAPIIFPSTREAAKYELYVMAPDGSGITRLTTNASQDTHPSLSPDGTRVTFASDRDGDDEIYVMNIDGSNVVKLTDNTVADRNPSWSGDGTKIAFESNRITNGNYELFSMNVDGTQQIRLTFSMGTDAQPAFSRDGTKIAFVSARDGDLEVFVMNADGTGTVQVTANLRFADQTPSWSGDSTRIAFTSDRDGDNEIWTMNADGSGLVQLTFNRKADQAPAWSRDGARILFITDRDRNFEIYRMNAVDSSVVRLTNHRKYDAAPTW